MRTIWSLAAAAVLFSASANAEAPRGAGGTFLIEVTEGGFLFRNRGGQQVTSLVGRTANLVWVSLTEDNVPSPSRPSENVMTLVQNRASIGFTGFNFGSQASNDPFNDPGQQRIGAGYVGTEQSGVFSVFVNCNSCPDNSVNFTFSNGDTSATGSGAAQVVDDGNFDYEGRIKFNIVGGSAYAIVPEPAAWALMIGGFGLVGAALRRRRTYFRVFSAATTY